MVKLRFMKVSALDMKKFNANALSMNAKGGYRLGLFGLIMVLGLAGCTPSLNWRAVNLDGVSTWLPCKPDRAQRELEIGGQKIQMEMMGCEAQGVMYAVSHAKVPNPSESQAVAAAWQNASFKQMLAGSPQQTVFQTRGEKPVTGQFFKLAGARSNGQELKAQLAWVVLGAEIYHLAMYAQAITSEQAEPFFSEVKIQ
jgi:hypothetical protein